MVESDGNTPAGNPGQQQEGDTGAESARLTGLGNVPLIVTSSGAGVSIKSTAFRLRELLLCFQFAEEFIANNGIELLLSITRRTTGNASGTHAARHAPCVRLRVWA